MNFGGMTTAAFTDRLTLIVELVVGLGLGTIILESVVYWIFSKVVRTRHALAFTLLAPAVIALALFTVYPLLYNVQLAFSDLRLRTFPCYTPPDVSTGTCPLAALQEGKTAQVNLDKLVLHTEPGDMSPTSGEIARGATITLIQQGKVAAPASSTSTDSGSGTGAAAGGLDLGGGVTLPGQDSNNNGAAAATTPQTVTDDRTWWQIKGDNNVQGWVPAMIKDGNKDTETLKRQPVLYSLEYGVQNFRDIFFDVDPKTGQITGWGRLLNTPGSTFPVLLARTALWTVLNVFFHLTIGFGLALLLNTKLRFKNIYRLIILLPWAIPQVIAALTWKAEFNQQYGFVNAVLHQFGIQPISWLQEPVPAFIAVLFVNVWLGVPFYMVVLTGGLGSISRDYYEAAEMDGANVWHRFTAITVPLIRPIAVPIITLDAIWTFNMFNVIYLVTAGEPNESTNILVTALYNAAFGPNGSARYAFAAAFSLVIFLLLLGLATIWVQSSGALKGVYD